MHRSFKTALLATLICLLAGCGIKVITTVSTDDQPDETDTDELLQEYDQIGDSGWQERSFVGHTIYSITGTGDNAYIKGVTDGKASVLYRQKTVDLTLVPVVSWRWKINNTYGDLEELTRGGDDFPARFYLVVQTGPLPWQTLAVNYVWSSIAQPGDTWTSPFTDRSKMMALQGGTSRVGEWVTEKRNIVNDFKLLFDVDIAKLDGYAFMIDGDNSGSSGTAWFNALQFSQQ